MKRPHDTMIAQILRREATEHEHASAFTNDGAAAKLHDKRAKYLRAVAESIDKEET